MKKIKLLWSLLLLFTSVQALELSTKIKAQIEDCQKGHVVSCYDVGMLLSTGENAEDQEKKNLGLEYIRRACKYGENKACDTLGENYFEDKHYGAAKPYFEASCERGVVSACSGLGTMYRDGLDMRQNDVKSRIYYEKACALNDKDACMNVAIIYRGGFGVDINRSMEKQYYQKACKAGSEVGCKSFRKMDNKDKGIEEPGLWEKFKSLFN